MPNWATNTVTIRGSKERLDELETAAENNELLKAIQHYDEWNYNDFVETYGTKWEPQGIDVHRDDAETLTLNFDSAWSPPIDAYNILAETVNDIDALFAEPGMDYCGAYYNGIVEEYSISSIAEQWLADGETFENVDVPTEVINFAEPFIAWHIESLQEEQEV